MIEDWLDKTNRRDMSSVEIFLWNKLSLIPPWDNSFSSMFLSIESVKENLWSSGQVSMPIVGGLHGDLPAKIDTLSAMSGCNILELA